MKNLYIYIVGFFLFFNNLLPAQAKIVLPEDFEGATTRQRVEELNNSSSVSEQPPLSNAQLIAITAEIGHYIMTKYTAKEVASEDFLETLRSIFPNVPEKDLVSRHVAIRNLYTGYEVVRSIYNKYIEKYLSPRYIKQVHSDEDFDHPNEVPYIEAKEGHFIKVYNFKKFLTYSQNPDENKAVTDYLIKKNKSTDSIAQLNDVLQKVDWKKVWFYGSVYDNPLLSKQGVTPKQTSENFTIRLLSQNTYIDDRKELTIGFFIQNETFAFILANNLDKTRQKPKVDLSGSENIAEYEILYPSPLNAENLPFAHKYFGDFLLPIKIKLQDPKKPVMINAAITLTSCTTFFECKTETFHFQMPIMPNGDELFSNGYGNLFTLALQQIPQPEIAQFKLKRFVVDELNQKQILRLEFTSQEKINNFKIFIEEVNGYTTFEAPYINLQDNKIYVRYEAVPSDKEQNLTGKEFIVTATLNNKYYYRTQVTTQEASIFDPQKPALNLGLLLLAILGGFILNFMPCVFPVLSLKIIALKQSSKLRKKIWKKTIIQTISGIFCGFSVLICAILIAKYLGYSLGWGMQFQNMGFLVSMTFILCCFTILMPSINFAYLSNFSTQKQNGKMNFLIGNLIVLLSTPCTGPYLATAIGFALGGTYTDIICILYAVALGLSLPYILLLKVKNPKKIFPKPGQWMNRLYLVTRWMLYLTIFWFFSLILGQTDWWCIAKIVTILLGFLAYFYLYCRLLDFLNSYRQAPEAFIKKFRRWTHAITLVIFLAVTFWAGYIATKSYEKNYHKNLSERSLDIDDETIQQFLRQGRPVLLEIRADWCMTCHANSFMLFNKFNLERWEKLYNLKYLQVDWTNYNQKTLEYMSRYGRKGLPFYILYTPFIREGLVLPEIFSLDELDNLLKEHQMR